MKIQFIKDHQGFVSGDVISSGLTKAKRLINDGIAIDPEGVVVSEKELKKPVITKEFKGKVNTKSRNKK